MDTNPIIPSKVAFYDIDGTPITEVQGVAPRSWRLNNVGQASLQLSILDEKCRREVLEFGRLVVISHEKLGLWSGPVDTPREWGGYLMTINAYSAEKLLDWRHGRMQMLKGTAGEIFEKIVTTANQEGDTLLRVGEVWTGGTNRQRELDYKSLLKEAQELAKLADNEFGVEPEIQVDGKLIYRAHWWQRRGAECAEGLKDGGEGANMEVDQKSLREQGEIWNDITGYGDGATWASRPIFRATDEDSVRQFGRRQKAQWFSGVKQESTLKENVESMLAEQAWPRKTFPCSALNVGNTWRNIRLGNTMPVEQRLAGFSDSGGVGMATTGRVLAYSYSEATQKVPLTMDEVRE